MPQSNENKWRDFADRMMREQLDDPDNLRDLLETIRPEWRGRFDFTRLERLNRELRLAELGMREADLLFGLPYRSVGGEKWVAICLLLEHQSQPDPRMPMRMLLYTAAFWDRQWRRGEEKPREETLDGARRKFTFVLPIVFHTGARPWNAPRDLIDSIDVPEELAPLAPRYQPLFFDLAAYAPEQLLEMTATWVHALAVVRADAADGATFRATLQRALADIGKLGPQEQARRRGLVHFLLGWSLNRRPEEERLQIVEEAAKSLANPEREEVLIMGRTIAEAIAAEAEQRGLEIGIEKGIEKGREEGREEGAHALREILVDQLVDRFGDIPDDARQRIAAAHDLGKLRAWISQANRALTLDELGI